MLKCLLCFEFWKAGSYVGYTISYFTHAPWPLSVLSVAHRSGFLLLCLVPKPLPSSRICLLWCMAFLLGTFVKCLFAFEMRTSNRCLEAVGGEQVKRAMVSGAPDLSIKTQEWSDLHNPHTLAYPLSNSSESSPNPSSISWFTLHPQYWRSQLFMF